MPRSELVGAGVVTSAGGITSYRGAAYPESYRDTLFVTESAGNLFYRLQLTPDGATFKAARVDGKAEMVADFVHQHMGDQLCQRGVAALAEAHRIALAPHNPQGPVSTAASLEFGFSQPSYIICETVHNDVPWRQDVVEEGFTIEKEGRIVRPNTKPGLGITINEAEVKKHPFQQEIVLRECSPDGGVADW